MVSNFYKTAQQPLCICLYWFTLRETSVPLLSPWFSYRAGSMFFRQVMFFQYIFAVFIALFPPDGMNMIGAVPGAAIVVKFNNETWSV